MRLAKTVLALPLVVAVACGSAQPKPAHGTASAAHQGGESTSPPTTLPIEAVPTATSSSDKSASGPTGTILMVKLHVGDSLAAGKAFYGSVFGAKAALGIGANASVVTFPHGGPGLVLLAGGTDSNQKGAFIIQVPSLQKAQALAVAHGATVQGDFAGSPNGMQARSVDLLDPWGNNIEILQIG